jgi:hypothetical protein
MSEKTIFKFRGNLHGKEVEYAYSALTACDALMIFKSDRYEDLKRGCLINVEMFEGKEGYPSMYDRRLCGIMELN